MVCVTIGSGYHVGPREWRSRRKSRRCKANRRNGQVRRCRGCLPEIYQVDYYRPTLPSENGHKGEIIRNKGELENLSLDVARERKSESNLAQPRCCSSNEGRAETKPADESAGGPAAHLLCCAVRRNYSLRSQADDANAADAGAEAERLHYISA
eukprot:2980810-Pleurochrysis_carterae.AAC.1